MCNVDSKKPRKIVPSIEALENRNLLTASLIHGVRSPVIQAVLESMMNMAPRPDHTVGVGGTTQGHREGPAHDLVKTNNPPGRAGNHSASVTNLATSRHVAPAGTKSSRMMRHDGIGCTAPSKVGGLDWLPKSSRAA